MMKRMSEDRMERVWKKAKKDSDVFNGVMLLAHPDTFHEPFDKAMEELSQRGNTHMLARIAKGELFLKGKENIAARKIAINVLARMNEKTRDEKIIGALMELTEDRDEAISRCAADSLPDDVKEERIGSLMRDLEREEDSNKRWDIFIKLYPFMDENLADKIFSICDEKEDAMIYVELLHFINRISLN
jgi:hypothetical protein